MSASADHQAQLQRELDEARQQINAHAAQEAGLQRELDEARLQIYAHTAQEAGLQRELVEARIEVGANVVQEDQLEQLRQEHDALREVWLGESPGLEDSHLVGAVKKQLFYVASIVITVVGAIVALQSII
ncbi:hypothetical protein CBOM_01079 [Ceraceosorus bombacis]|uniref:Uncharacterized protein n=1 Tax=Ceraceosorus bombacis TaxID=401625 RepID=A0A0P1BBT3_9BASI|nr:hypothetical protein CBOM_01079 [Ceraceosorus bombacis]